MTIQTVRANKILLSISMPLTERLKCQLDAAQARGEVFEVLDDDEGDNSAGGLFAGAMEVTPRHEPGRATGQYFERGVRTLGPLPPRGRFLKCTKTEEFF